MFENIESIFIYNSTGMSFILFFRPWDLLNFAALMRGRRKELGMSENVCG